MYLERQHESVESGNLDRELAPSDSELSVEPNKISSLTEAAEQGRVEFLDILRAANIRGLVRYIESGGVKIDNVVEIPTLWKVHFKTRGFRNQSYTWHNPKLCLITARRAATLALVELLKRLNSIPPL